MARNLCLGIGLGTRLQRPPKPWLPTATSGIRKRSEDGSSTEVSAATAISGRRSAPWATAVGVEIL